MRNHYLKHESGQFLYKLRLASKLTNLKPRETVEEEYQIIKNASTTLPKGHWNTKKQTK